MTKRETTGFGPGCDETGKVNYDLPPRGVSYGKPLSGMRNWDCRVDDHEMSEIDPSMCVQCHAIVTLDKNGDWVETPGDFGEVINVEA